MKRLLLGCLVGLLLCYSTQSYLNKNRLIYRANRVDNLGKIYASITPPVAKSKYESTNNKSNNNEKRFIHPQVYKMYQRARYLLKQGDNAVAQKLLMRCLELNPYDSHSWLALARLEAKLGNIDKARELFTQSMIRCPNNVHILHAWGHMEQKYGNESLARDCWSKAIVLDPDNAYVCHALSNLEKRHRNFEEARIVLEKVVWRKPTSAICVSLSELERQLGHPERAKEVLLHGMKTCSVERSKLLLSLAWLEEDYYNNTDEAKRLIDEAMKIDKANVRVHVAKANLELRLNMRDAARNTLQAATFLSAEDAQHYTMWATLEIEDGKHAAAIKILEEGARKYPGDQFLLQRWGTLEMKLGNSNKAKTLFEKSIIIRPHAPTFVAWAILEEQEGIAIISPQPLFTNTVKDEDDLIEQTIGKLVDSADVPTDSHGNHNDMPPLPAEPSHELRKKASTQFQKARQLFSIGMIVDPQHGPLYHAYGNMEQRRGNYTGARDIFMRGISMNCTDVTSLYHAWGLLELKDSVSVARDIFHKGIELGLNGNKEVDSGVGFLLHSLGMLELDNGRADESKRVFSTGVSLFPHHSQMLLGLALASMRLGDGDVAREYFKASVDSDPLHAHAWQSWAIAEKQAGNIELARVLFRQGLTKGPMHGALWQAFGVMEMQQGNHDIARTLFAQSVKRCPSHAQSYQAWACLEVRTGNLKKAKGLVTRGIRRAPSHPALWTAAGLVEERLGDIPKARQIFIEGLERFPKHGALYKSLGELEARQGVYNKAREYFTNGLQHDPQYAPVYHAAALLEAKLGNIAGLAELHKQAINRFEIHSMNTGNKDSDDIIERIRQIEAQAIEDKNVNTRLKQAGGSKNKFDSVYTELPSHSDESFNEAMLQ